MNEILLKVFTYGALGLFAGLAVVLAAILLLSAFLIMLLGLQFLGALRRVPFSYNYRNLVVRWRTTALTTLAFILVVGLMTVMRSFVNGMYALTKGSAIPGNVMVLADGATDELFSDLGYGDISLLSNRDCIKKARVRLSDKEEDTPLISWELYQVVSQEIPNAKPGGRMRRFIQVRGVEEPVVSALVHELELYEGGRWFDPGVGVQAVAGESEPFIQGVVGEGLAREIGPDLGKPALQPGDRFTLGPRQWVVVGVMKSAGKTFDSEVWAKRTVVGQMLRKDTRSTAVVRVRDDLDPAETANSLTREFKSPAIQARTELDYFESLNSTNEIFLTAIYGVAGFMAIGGVCGIMCSMFAAIAQRTRDIGVLRILGYARWQILVSFFAESLLMALLGGALGCAIGSLANGLSATAQLSSGNGGGGKSVVLKMVVDRSVLGEGMAFALLMGCIGGLLPALSAIRLKVLDSLR